MHLSNVSQFAAVWGESKSKRAVILSRSWLNLSGWFMTTCGQSQWPVQSIRSTVTSWPVSKTCVCVSVWIKGSLADSAAVQCHTGSPSGMFLIPGMGRGASLAEPPLPLPCQPALGTTHLRCTLGERQLPVNHFRLRVSFCLSVWHLAGSLSS